jgi:hypothetical protein
MSAITWTRHEYTPISDATEREAWYTAAGLDGWFDITSSGTDNDKFTLQPYTDGARLVLNWAYMNARSGQSWEQMDGIKFYLAGASATTTYNGTTKPQASSEAGNLSFDFATVGSVELLRMCTTENSWNNEVIFARDTATTADGATAKLVVMNNSYGNNAAYPRAGGYIILADTTGSAKYNSNTSNSVVQYRSDSVTYCDKFILQPIETLGIISHIYAIDGSPNYAPAGDVEFTLGSHTYYSLGHGMCVRVK